MGCSTVSATYWTCVTFRAYNCCTRAADENSREAARTWNPALGFRILTNTTKRNLKPIFNIISLDWLKLQLALNLGIKPKGDIAQASAVSGSKLIRYITLKIGSKSILV